ncbi:GIN domain-containing protein [Flavitalea antarctica]
MKKQFLLIASFLVIAIASFATGKPSVGKSSRSWSVDQPFGSISAKGNIEVVLVHDDSKTISIEGFDKYVNEVDLNVDNGVLKITGAKGTSRNRTIVYVPVRDLNKVTLKGGADLSSRGRLESKQLFIRIEGVSKVNVKNIGEVIIDSDDQHQFFYEKSERSIIRVEKA